MEEKREGYVTRVRESGTQAKERRRRGLVLGMHWRQLGECVADGVVRVGRESYSLGARHRQGVRGKAAGWVSVGGKVRLSEVVVVLSRDLTDIGAGHKLDNDHCLLLLEIILGEEFCFMIFYCHEGNHWMISMSARKSMARLLWIWATVWVCRAHAENADVDMDKLWLEATKCNLEKIDMSEYADIREVCKEFNDGGQESEIRDFMVVEKIMERTVDFYRCEKFVTTETFTCGAYSHYKVLQFPQFNMRERMTVQECDNVRAHGLYEPEKISGLGVLPVNGEAATVEYHYESVGKITRTSDNSQCESGTLDIEGKTHTNVIQLKNVRLEFRRVPVRVDLVKGKLREAASGLELGNECMNGACMTKFGTYVALGEVGVRCEVERIAKMQFRQVGTMVNGQIVPLYVNDVRRIAMLSKGVTFLQTCGAQARAISTNLKDIYLVDDLRAFLNARMVEGENVMLWENQQATEQYMEYRLLRRIKDNVNGLTSRLCQENMGKLETNEIHMSPYTDNKLVRVRGDVLEGVSCENVHVRPDIEHGLEYCLLDYLPVVLDGKRWYLESRTHLLHDFNITSEMKVECRDGPYFRSNVAGIFLKMNPDIRAVKFNL